jgi:hypothetical protein
MHASEIIFKLRNIFKKQVHLQKQIVNMYKNIAFDLPLLVKMRTRDLYDKQHRAKQ